MLAKAWLANSEGQAWMIKIIHNEKPHPLTGVGLKVRQLNLELEKSFSSGN